jgi:hypothetical protein
VSLSYYDSDDDDDDDKYTNLLYPVLPAASIHILLIAILLILLSLSHSTLIAIIIFDKPDINNFYRNRRRMPP